MIGVLAQVLADNTGSAAARATSRAPSISTRTEEGDRGGQEDEQDKVDYPTLHEAGIEIHTARRAYREYLVTEAEKRHVRESPGAAS